MSDTNEVRDAVIKLEAKMELMSESMVSMADSVAKLADIRFEIVAMKKDIANLHKVAEKRDLEMDNIGDRLRQVENAQNKTTYVIGKIELLWGAVVTGAVSFVYWLLKG